MGVDRYRAQGVQWLTSAARDATALHTMFSDTLGGRSTLLIDEQATRTAMADAFAALAASDEGDFVVVSFSGHGSPAHELAPFDADPYSPDGTLVSADDLAAWFSAVPARNLILILDCCFSGGHGAKVLQQSMRRRDLGDGEAALDSVAGAGRFLLTASAANEPAWEDVGSGHGLLTGELLAALQGPPEVVSGGIIRVLRLLEFVTGRVADRARALGRTQTPSMRGSLDGEVEWPVFRPGPLYLAAFPGRIAATARPDLASLTAFGFPAGLVAAWAGDLPGLNELQVSAINDYGLLDGSNLLVSAPTSSGKTMVGELAALRGVMDRRRAIFLLPTKALVHDKKRQFDRVYGAFGVTTVEATGETEDIGPLIRGRFDVALLTYEKFMAIAIGFPHVLDQAGSVVVDEVQMVADETRGWNLEFLLTLLVMHSRGNGAPQVIVLSAVIGDTNGFERWLGGRLLRRHDRPVPLDEGLLLADGSFRFRDGVTGEETRSAPLVRRRMIRDSSQDWVVPLVQRLVGEGKRVIVFRETTGEARSCAEYLASALGLPSAQEAIADLPPGDPSRASGALHACMASGVAFHISHLALGERRVVEEHFRRPDGRLRVLVATTTLAMGVNTPAEAVVIVGLEHPGGRPYSVAEYKNLAGRAGRLGYAERGASYLLALDSRTEHDLWRRYVSAAPEDLESRFLAANPRTMIVRVVAASRRRARTPAQGMTAPEIAGFLEASFGAFRLQHGPGGTWSWDSDQILGALTELERDGLVSSDTQGRYGLTPLGEVAGETGVEVESLIRVASYIRRLDAVSLTDPALLALAQITVEVDQVRMPFNTKSVGPGHKEPMAWFEALGRQAVPPVILNALRSGLSERGQDVMRAKKAVACLFYIQGEDMLRIEAALTQFGGAFGGVSGQVRQTTARVCDVLPMVGKVAMLLHPGVEIGARVARLLVRLDIGVIGAVAELAAHARANLDRTDYGRLAAAGLGDPLAATAASDDALLHLLGGSRAKIAVLRKAARAAAADRRPAEGVAVLEPFVA